MLGDLERSFLLNPVILVALLILLWLLLLYVVYVGAHYVIKMIVLKSLIKDMKKSGARVQQKRRFFGVLFGKKGNVDYVMDVDDKKYELCILSFAALRGHWNIEQARGRYYVECRRQKKPQFGEGGVSDDLKLFKSERRVARKELFLTPIDESFEKQILLIYPWPNRMTYTDSHYHDVTSCKDQVEGHVMMNVEDFYRLMTGKEE